MIGAKAIFPKIWISALFVYLLSCFALVHAQSKVKIAIVVYSKEDSLSELKSRLKNSLEEKLSSIGAFELVDVYARLKDTGTNTQPDDNWDKVEHLIDQGRKSYDSLELDKAVSYLKQAEELIFSNPSSSFKVKTFTQALTYLGASYVFLGKKKEGMRVFKRLLIINPKAKLDPMLFPPSLSSTFAKVLENLKNKHKAEVLLKSDPQQAEIWIDGQEKGRTPKKLSILPGRHVIRLIHSGYKPTGRSVEIRAGARKEINVSLDMLMGTAWLSALLQRLEIALGAASYPDEVDQLLRKVSADRFVFVDLSSQADGIRVRGYHWDGVSGRRLRSMESVLDPSSPEFSSKIDSMFAAISMDPSAAMVGKQDAEGLSYGDSGESGYGEQDETYDETDEGHADILHAWWLWTAVGVVVVGAGLTAGLLLINPEEANSAQVVFRF